MRVTDEELEENILELSNELNLRLDVEEGWQDVLKRVHERHRQARQFRRRIVFIASLALVLVLSVWTATATDAWSLSLWEQVDHWTGGTLHTIRGVFGPGTRRDAPQISSETEYPRTFEFSTLAEAQMHVPFPILVPTWVPDGYALTTISVTVLSLDSAEVRVVFASERSGFEVIESRGGGEQGTGQMYDSDDTVVREVIIGPQSGLLTTHKTGYRNLRWHNSGYRLAIRGLLSENDVIRVAETIQP